MDASPETAPVAWQPLTGRGVAKFARAPLGHLLLVQLAVALLVGALVAGFLRARWFPVISEAIARLPVQGEIVGGQLRWNGDPAVLLAENRFLALAVDLNHAGVARSPAHLELEFGASDFRLISLLGFVQFRYPASAVFAFNQDDLEPWWGAWKPPILALVVLGVSAGLLLTWMLLATIYWPGVWLAAFFADRAVSFLGSWRLAGAALMPGALLMSTVLAFYWSGTLDLVHLIVAVPAHMVVGWCYLALGVFCLPARLATPAEKANPFVDQPPKPPPASGEKPAA